MKLHLVTFAAIAFCAVSGYAKPLTSLNEIEDRLVRGTAQDIPFEVTAKVLSPRIPEFHGLFMAGDSDHALRFYDRENMMEADRMKPGDTVRIAGLIRKHAVVCKSMTVVGRDPPPAARPLSGDEFYALRTKSGHVRLRGTVRSVLPDEIDPNFCLIVLNSSSRTIPITLCTLAASADFLARLPGSEVEVSGFFDNLKTMNRPKVGRWLCVYHPDAMTILSSDVSDRFDKPDISTLEFGQPSELLKLGRFRATGTVIARWNPNHFLLRTGNGEICRIDIARGEPPDRGACVEVIGFPETDFYHINLSCATYRKVDGTPAFGNLTTPVSTDDLFDDTKPLPRIRPRFQGKTVTFEGIVRNAGNGMLDVDFKGRPLTVNASRSGSPANVVPGTRVRITGTCILDTINWRAVDTFPHVKSIFVVTHGPSDILVLASPSWWTPSRLLSVIAALLAVVIAILIWNVSLRRLAAKRGRELADKTIAQAESELKVYERTRLATELHDSLAQILTGVAFKLETADRLSETNPTAMRKHLGIAIRSLQACRDDLRNCLWDLRNHALEIPDMDTAIRRTLEQHLEGTKLRIRFNISRELLSDNTTHEILCIIRELVLNAIRHGHATEIRVAGAIEGDILRFSVIDNGCGFDPDRVPGMREGHYGLQGVRERAAHLDGEFTILANGTSGMKAVVSIKIPHTT